MNAQKYNGWTNRETWLVHLHGFTDAVEQRWIFDMFEPDGSLCGTYLATNQIIDRRVTWNEIASNLKDEFITALRFEIHAEVEHYLDEVAHLDNVFVQDLLPDVSLRGGVINYWELADSIFHGIKEYAEGIGWDIQDDKWN